MTTRKDVFVPFYLGMLSLCLRSFHPNVEGSREVEDDDLDKSPCLSKRSFLLLRLRNVEDSTGT